MVDGVGSKDDDDEGFQSAFGSEQRVIDMQRKLLQNNSAPKTGLLGVEAGIDAGGAATFNAHQIDTQLPSYEMNRDLIEEAK